ncbi:MAG: SRPBCC family protein [Motilibacteraceae bacterium]
MATLTRSITIDAPAAKVFDYVLDPQRFWTWPDLALVDVKRTPDGVGTTAKMWSHFLGFHLEGSLEYTEVVRPERITITVGFAIEHPTWTFTFAPGDGGTELTAQGEWHSSLPVVGPTFEKQMAKEHEDFLEQLLAKAKGAVESPVSV